MTPAQQGPCDRGPQELAQRSGPATSRVVGSRFLAYFWVKWGAELKGAISDCLTVLFKLSLIKLPTGNLMKLETTLKAC